MSSEWPERAAPLAPLGRRFKLTDDQIGLLRGFATILAHDLTAPTTVRDPARVRDDHLADALVALALPSLNGAGGVVADLGSGAGVPGVPLAIARPGASVILVEGTGRKCEFLASVVDRLGIPNVEVVHARAETWTEGIGACDVVTARALAPLDVVLEYAAPLLKIGGSLVVWRGGREPTAESAALRAADILGLDAAEPLRVEPYPGAERRHLHVFAKTRQTPSRFPRRDGVARKRPLGTAASGDGK